MEAVLAVVIWAVVGTALVMVINTSSTVMHRVDHSGEVRRRYYAAILGLMIVLIPNIRGGSIGQILADARFPLVVLSLSVAVGVALGMFLALDERPPHGLGRVQVLAAFAVLGVVGASIAIVIEREGFFSPASLANTAGFALGDLAASIARAARQTEPEPW